MNTPHELLQEMEAAFPETLPTPGQSPEEIMYRAGQRSVVFFLRNIIDEKEVKTKENAGKALMEYAFSEFPVMKPGEGGSGLVP